jgi:putative DNA primase/helicase
LLGTNTTIRAATNALWLATMNNFRVIGDLVRRVLVSRIDAKTERPEERTFEIKDLRQHLLDNRKALVIAVLTILRAYHVAGRPRQENLKIFGGFEQWSSEIRTPLIWLGLPDPCGSRKFVREGDSERDALGAVLAAWHDAIITDTLTVGEVIARTVKNEAKAEQERSAKLTALRDALLVVAADYRHHDIIDPRRLGAWLADQGTTVDGLRFERAGKSHSAILWKVAVIEPAELDEAGS